MQPVLVVVAQIPREGAAQRRFREKHDAAREFRLQRVKEGLRARIVAGATHTRTLGDAVARDEGAEGRAHVLGAAIAVEDQPASWAPAAERSAEHATRFSRSAAPTEGPREHAAGMMIEDDGEIAPTAGEAEIRDVADPKLIAARDVRRPDPIRMLRKACPNSSFRAIATHRFRACAGRAHQAGDATATARPPSLDQLFIQARTAVPCLVSREATQNLDGQSPVLARVRTLAAAAPRVEPRARDVVAAAEWGDFEAFVLRDEVVDEGEDLAFRALQNRMAFFKRSCSALSSAYCRSSACSCAISRVGPGGGAFGERSRSRPALASFRHLDNMKG